MDGMLVSGFGVTTDSDIAVSQSFHHEFAPTNMICELSLSSASENDDEAGTNLGFTSFTFVDERGNPQEMQIDFGERRAHIGHNNITRVEWYMRVYNVSSKGLFNAFFWSGGVS